MRGKGEGGLQNPRKTTLYNMAGLVITTNPGSQRAGGFVRGREIS
jgi:hypothetical protein